MDSNTVRRLEDELEKEIAKTICRLGLKKLPFLPSHHTMKMMAKAATPVYEAAAENRPPD